MPLTIRPANALDIDQLAPLVEKYRAFYKQQPSPRTRQYLIERIESGEALVFLANLDSHLIGFTLKFRLKPDDINRLTVGEFEVYKGALDAMIEFKHFMPLLSMSVFPTVPVIVL